MKLRIVKVTKGDESFYIVQCKRLFFWINEKNPYLETDVLYESFKEAKRTFDRLALKTKKEIVHKNY